MKFFAILALVVLLGVASACTLTITPSPANASGIITANASGTYWYKFTDYYGTTLQAASATATYTINTSYNQTRVFAYANGSDTCNSSVLVIPTSKQGLNNNFFSTTVLAFFNASQDLFLAIIFAGIAYGISMKYGAAAVMTSLMYAGAFVLWSNPLFLIAAIPLLIVGLVLIYAGI